MAQPKRTHLRLIEGKEYSSSSRHGLEATSDAELVEAAQTGERRAEETLARRYVDDVTSLVERLLGSKTDVEDLVQDTFYFAFRDLKRLSVPAAFRGWLFRIAVNRVRKTIRRRRLLRAIGLDSSEGAVFIDELAHGNIRPEVRSELVALDQILRRLPADQRVAWMLRHVQGYHIKDVARLSSCSLATAKRRIAAAHTKVRAAVELEVLHHG